jgi:hypothetical protein
MCSYVSYVVQKKRILNHKRHKREQKILVNGISTFVLLCVLCGSKKKNIKPQKTQKGSKDNS